MKQIIVLVAVAVLLTSCATSVSVVPDKFDRPLQLTEWVYQNITWEDAPDTEDTVSPAAETLNRGKGSCYDQCVVWIELAKKSGWEDAKLYPVILPNGKGHMCVSYNCGIWDPTNNKAYYLLPSGWSEFK